MRIAVMGAGGLGAYIGARLAAAGDEVVFIARGAHLAAMRTAGLQVRSAYGDHHLGTVDATDTPAMVGPVDLVLFTVKLWDTDAAAAALAPLIGPDTRVVTLQNGIDSVDIIATHVPRHQVIAGATYIPAVVREPGVVINPGGNKKIMVDRNGGHAAIADFAASSARAIGLETELTDNIGPVLWRKFLGVSAFSAATTLMRSTVGPIRSNPESRAFLRQLVEDGAAVAAATGNDFGPALADEMLAFYDTFPAEQRSSMSEDLSKGHRLELPWLSGRIHDLGLQHGIPTPAHTAAYRALILHANGRPGQS